MRADFGMMGPMVHHPNGASAGPGDPAPRPALTLVLLSVAHAVIHAQGVLLPLVYLRIITEFGVGVDTIAYLAAFGSVATGTIQLAYAKLTRVTARRRLLAAGSFVVGAGFAAQALAPTFAAFALTSIVARLGGSPQHPVGNALLAEQFPERRRGFAISAHITGGNVGTVVVALAGAWAISTFDWRGAVVLFGLPGVLVALAILGFVRESGEDRAAAVAEGSVRSALGAVARDRDHRWIFLASIIGGGGRGLGVVNLFALVYLTAVLGVEQGTADLMYGVFIALSVPAPLVAGWLSDRFGRKPLIVGVYLGGAVGFVAFLLVGSGLVGLWVGILVMGAFSFAESPQLQALLADIAPPRLRDASFALYFTLSFGVGSLWTAVYGAVIQVAGNAAGLPIVFWLMAASYVAAALAILPVHAGGRPGPMHRPAEIAEIGLVD